MADSRFSFDVIQNCWVVPDLQQAMEKWLALGVGPFLTLQQNMSTARYRGNLAPVSVNVALAQAGSVQIELIEVLSDGPSAYRDSVPEGQSGLHHICRSFGGYDESVARLKAAGIEMAMEVEMGGVRLAYADTRPLIGCMTELVDEHPFSRKLIDIVRDAAIDWDGSDPIRRHPLFKDRGASA